MEKPTTYIACLLVLVSTGCDKTVLEFPENGGVDPTLVNMNLTLAIDPKIEPYEPTGRSEAPEADTHDVRWIVEVFRDEIGGEPVEPVSYTHLDVYKRQLVKQQNRKTSRTRSRYCLSLGI